MNKGILTARNVLSPKLELSAPTGNLIFDRLDVLRTIAVLYVFIDHMTKALGIPSLVAGKYAPIGRAGVLFFFIHTSLVLMFSLQRQTATLGKDRLWMVFMIRRVFRIYPLSMFLIVIVVLFQIPSRDITPHFVDYVPTNFTGFVSNMLLAQNIVVPNTEKADVLGVLWTLPLEVQMYMLLPLLFILVSGRGSLLKIGLAWGVALLASLATGIIYSADRQTIATFDTFHVNIPDVLLYAPAFVAGVVAYVLWNWHRPTIPFVALPIALIGFVCVQWVFQRFTSLSPTERIYPELIMCLVVGASLPFVAEPSSRLVANVCGWIAKYSYGIYLLHVPCIWIGFQVGERLPLIVQLAVAVLLTGTLSMALFHALEQPMIRIGGQVSKKFATAPTSSSTKNLAET